MRRMVGVRLEDCAEWLAQGLSIAPNGSKWPQHKKATIKWQLEDCAGQLKKLWHGNQRVTPAKKNVVRQWMDCTGQKKKLRRGNQGIATASSKFVAQQSGYHAFLFKNAAWQSGYCTCLFKICPRLGYCVEWLERGLRVVPNGWRKA